MSNFNHRASDQDFGDVIQTLPTSERSSQIEIESLIELRESLRSSSSKH